MRIGDTVWKVLKVPAKGTTYLVVKDFKIDRITETSSGIHYHVKNTLPIKGRYATTKVFETEKEAEEAKELLRRVYQCRG